MVVSAVRARMSCSTSLGVRVKRQYSYLYFYVSPPIVEWSSTFRVYVSTQLRSSMGTNPSEGFVFWISFFLPLNIDGLQVIVLRAPSVTSNLFRRSCYLGAADLFLANFVKISVSSAWVFGTICIVRKRYIYVARTAISTLVYGPTCSKNKESLFKFLLYDVDWCPKFTVCSYWKVQLGKERYTLEYWLTGVSGQFSPGFRWQAKSDYTLWLHVNKIRTNYRRVILANNCGTIYLSWLNNGKLTSYVVQLTRVIKQGIPIPQSSLPNPSISRLKTSNEYSHS